MMLFTLPRTGQVNELNAFANRMLRRISMRRKI